MNYDNLDIIFDSGLNVAEFHILTIFASEGSSKRDSLARYANSYFGDVRPDPAPTIDEYNKAIEFCLERGFIKVLSEDDCKRDRERWLHDDNQFCEEDIYVPGNLDFTIKGVQFYRELKEKMYKKKGISSLNWFDGLVGFKWKHKGVVSLLSKNRKCLEKEIESVRDNSSNLLTSKWWRLIEIGKPYPIGNWWVTRFEQLDKGWRVDIKYIDSEKKKLNSEL